MSKMVQIRNVPDNVHRQLKARAAIEGLSLSEYVLAEMKRALERPTREELLARLRPFDRNSPRPSPAKAVRAERDSR